MPTRALTPAGFEMLAMGDLSLLVKAGVQRGLFGGAILHLGTERHHARSLADTIDLDVLGCFAMTDTGHGSDVASLRTTATFDPATDEFVITTPDDSARKEYIGNAARDGRLAAVFAQLVTGGESQGVHAFVVPIRDDSGTPLPGVRIEDVARIALDRRIAPGLSIRRRVDRRTRDESDEIRERLPR